jgi:hypothetical protein
LAVEAGLGLIVGSLFFFSCGRKESGVLIETVDGVRVVRNLVVKPERALKNLDVIEDLTLGGDERSGEALFFVSVDIDADSKGNIYVLDQRDALIRYFDAKGSFLGTIGRKGQGPGEFESPIGMEIVQDGNIVIVDPSLMRLTHLAPDGRLINTVILKNYVSDIGSGRDGTVIVGYSDPGNSETCVGVLDIATGQVTRLFGQRTYWPARTMNDAMTYDFPYFVRFARDSKGRLFVGSAVSYELSVMDTKGRLEFKFKKDKERIPVQGELLDRIAGISLRGPNPYIRDPYFPFFDSLAVDEQDRIWIRHYLPRFSARTNPETPYDVFSSDGIFLFETRIPGHVYSKLVFKNGFVYALKKAEPGSLLAVRLRIEE